MREINPLNENNFRRSELETISAARESFPITTERIRKQSAILKGNRGDRKRDESKPKEGGK